MSLVYTTIAMVALSGFVSLGVDLGRVRLAKAELQTASDAGARAAAMKLGMGHSLSSATLAAVDTAALNIADGTSVALVPEEDVEFGAWDPSTRTFAALTGASLMSADAIRVTARRIQARQNPVQLAFGALVGKSIIDVQASAIAIFKSKGYGVVGLDYIYMTGNATDSYWSDSGPYSPGTAQGQGSIASNGDITLNGSSAIHGNAYAGVGKTVYGASNVYGKVQNLTEPLSFPNGDPGTAPTTNDNWRLPPNATPGSDLKLGKNQVVSAPGGVYYFRDVQLESGSSLTFTGPATLYAYGSFVMSGSAVTSGNLPKNLKVVMVPGPTGTAPGTVNIGSSSGLYADVYAPQSPIILSGTGDIFGSVLGKSVSMTGTSHIHYDSSLGGKPSISLVR